MSHESLTQVATHFKLADVTALYAAVGEGNLSAQAVVRRVIDLHGGDEGAAEDLAEGVTITGRQGRRKVVSGDSGVIVPGAEEIEKELYNAGIDPVRSQEMIFEKIKKAKAEIKIERGKKRFEKYKEMVKNILPGHSSADVNINELAVEFRKLEKNLEDDDINDIKDEAEKMAILKKIIDEEEG
jgi:hypothetical protein